MTLPDAAVHVTTCDWCPSKVGVRWIYRVRGRNTIQVCSSCVQGYRKAFENREPGLFLKVWEETDR